MPSKFSTTFKKFWHDSVGSQVISTVIASVIIGLATLAYSHWKGSASDATPQRLNPPASSPASADTIRRYPAVTLEELKNLTYQIDDDRITLNDGKREFNPDADLSSGPNEKAIFVSLVDYAFGDLNGDGNEGAAAVLEVSGGGSGIFYYLAPVFNEMGTPTITGPAYFIGDRLVFRGVVVSPKEVDVELMMHAPDDPLCCPTAFRHLKFSIVNKSLQCKSTPCSEV